VTLQNKTNIMGIYLSESKGVYTVLIITPKNSIKGDMEAG